MPTFFLYAINNTIKIKKKKRRKKGYCLPSYPKFPLFFPLQLARHRVDLRPLYADLWEKDTNYSTTRQYAILSSNTGSDGTRSVSIWYIDTETLERRRNAITADTELPITSTVSLLINILCTPPIRICYFFFHPYGTNPRTMTRHLGSNRRFQGSVLPSFLRSILFPFWKKVGREKWAKNKERNAMRGKKRGDGMETLSSVACKLYEFACISQLCFVFQWRKEEQKETGPRLSRI